MKVVLYDKSNNNRLSLGYNISYAFTGSPEPDGVLALQNEISFIGEYNPITNKIKLTFDYGTYKTLTNRTYTAKNHNYVIKVNGTTLVNETISDESHNMKSITHELSCNQDGSLPDTNIYTQLDSDSETATAYSKKIANSTFKKNNIWKNAFVWIKILNIWKRCIVWKKINGIWKKSN